MYPCTYNTPISLLDLYLYYCLMAAIAMDPNETVTCYLSDNCSGDGSNSTREECCSNLRNPVGYSLVTASADQCQQCPLG
jgi:hypothetical protein